MSSSAILLQVYPPLSTLLAVALPGDRIGWRTASGTGLAFVGVMIVALKALVLAQLDVSAPPPASAFLLAQGMVLMRRVRCVGALAFQGWNALPSVALMAIAFE